MGLYFPDADRPKGRPCPLRQDAPFRAPYCPIYNACSGDACPAIDVGPHGRLNDRDALWREINKICDRRDAGIISDLACLQQLLSAIRHAPTIIQAEEGE